MRLVILLIIGYLQVGCAPVPAYLPVSSESSIPVTPSPIVEASPSQSPTPALHATLTPTPAPVALSLVNIHMSDSQNGWAVDQNRRLLRTDAGPGTWQDVTPWTEELERSTLQPSVFFLDSQTVMAAVYFPMGDESLAMNFWRTKDGGASWNSTQTLFKEQEAYFHSGYTQLIFTDDRHGWLYMQIYPGMYHCDTVIYATLDGGDTWNLVESSLRNTDGSLTGAYSLLYGPKVLTFLNEKVGFAGNGSLMATYDGGHTWQMQSLPQDDDVGQYFVAITPAWFSSEMDGVVIANSYDPDQVELPPPDHVLALPKKSALYITQDGGKTWQMHPAPALAGSLDFLTAKDGWYLGATGISQTALYRTKDGGATWTAIVEDAVLPQGTTLSFTDPDFGVAYNFYGSANRQNRFDRRSSNQSYLFVTYDGGVNWETVDPIYTLDSYNAPKYAIVDR